MDVSKLGLGAIQAYVILSPDQIARIRDIFEISEREDISQTVQIIVEQYIKEHTPEDIRILKADDAWAQFTTKFNDGWLS